MKRFSEEKRKASDELLYDGVFVQLRKLDGFYEYLKNKGEGVLVLMVDRTNSKFLCRFENTPVHNEDPDSIDPTSLTGTIDPGYTQEETVVKETLEESGYDISAKELVPLGYCYGSKASDTRLFMYAVWMDEESHDEICYGEGDGTKGEEDAHCRWLDLNRIGDLNSPAVALAALRAGVFTLPTS